MNDILTDEQLAEIECVLKEVMGDPWQSVVAQYYRQHIPALIATVRHERARAQAAEAVVEAARRMNSRVGYHCNKIGIVSHFPQDENPQHELSECWVDLDDALATYDAAKEPADG